MTDYGGAIEKALRDVCEWLSEQGENELAARLAERWRWYAEVEALGAAVQERDDDA